MGYVDKDKGIVIDWELRTIKEKVEINPESGSLSDLLLWRRSGFL